MRHSGWAEMKGEGPKLAVFPSVALAVQALHQESKERQFMRVRGQLSRRTVAQVGKDRITLLVAALNRAVEGPRPESLLTAGFCHTASTQVVFVLDAALPTWLAWNSTVVIRRSEVF
jgi:dienelactone hydrolase